MPRASFHHPGARGDDNQCASATQANPADADGCDLLSPRASLCGGVLWPGARSAAEALARHSLEGARVVELGAGTGLVSLIAASLGAAPLYGGAGQAFK